TFHMTQHLLGYAPRGQARDGRCKINVTPFWMAVGFQKLVPLGKKGLGKPSHTPIAIGIFRPVENCEHRRHRDSVDPLPLRNQRRIFLSGELAERVHVGKSLRKGNGHQVKARICGNLREEADRLANHRTRPASSPDLSFCSAVALSSSTWSTLTPNRYYSLPFPLWFRVMALSSVRSN